MINQQLLDYVRAQHTAGLSKEAIAQALSSGGWTANDVNEAFMAIEGVRVPPPPPPPSPNQPVQPRTIIPPVTAQEKSVYPIPPSINTTPNPTPRPLVAASEFSTIPTHKRRGVLMNILSILLILILLVAASIGVLAFVNPTFLATYIPQIEMFFPATPEETVPHVDTTPLVATTSPTSATTSTATSTP